MGWLSTAMESAIVVLPENSLANPCSTPLLLWPGFVRVSVIEPLFPEYRHERSEGEGGETHVEKALRYRDPSSGSRRDWGMRWNIRVETHRRFGRELACAN